MDEEYKPLVSSYLKTVPCRKISFKWTVQKFSELCYSDASLHGRCNLYKNTVTDLQLHANLTLYADSDDALKLKVTLPFEFQCSVVFRNALEEVLYEERGNSYVLVQYPDDSETSLFTSDVKMTLLANLPQDSLSIQCFVTKNKLGNTSFSISHCLDPSIYLRSLCQNLKDRSIASLQEKVYLRIGLKSEPVNKAILCSMSSVFEKMFQSGMKEAEENVVDIEDIEFPVIMNMAYFLNSGIVRDTDFESVCSLYYAANKYNILGLRSVCGELLEFHLTVENVCRVLSLSDRHNDKELKTRAIYYFHERMENVLVTDHWYNLMRDETKLGLQVIEESYSIRDTIICQCH